MASVREARFDWGALGSLKLRARTVADGVFAGAHRSTKRGAGVEFGGHRNYLPGDDLRFLDRRVLMRHGKLAVRLFETETERSVNLVVDASPSMLYRSEQARENKLSFATLIAAALARVALRDGDVVSLDWFCERHNQPIASVGGSAAFDRLVDALEHAEAGEVADANAQNFERMVERLNRNAKRGAIVVLFSDLLDLPADAAVAFARLAGNRRIPIVLRVLDPVERNFSFSGPVRLRASESQLVVETDAEQVRQSYLQALEASRERWAQPLLGAGGRVVDCTSSDDPVSVLREVLLAAGNRLT